MRTELAEGLRYVFGHRYLRWIAASTATFNFFGNVMGAIFLVYAVRQLDLCAGAIGLVFAIGNVGYLVGAITSNRIAQRIGVGPAIVVGAACGIAALLIPLAPESSPDPLPHRFAADHRLRVVRSTTSRRSATARRSRPSGSRAG